jgi:hypothetical protein
MLSHWVCIANFSIRPLLLADIMDVIRTNLEVLCGSPNNDQRSTLALRRGLALLNSVLKEFSGVKLLAGVNTMVNVCHSSPRYYFRASFFIRSSINCMK